MTHHSKDKSVPRYFEIAMLDDEYLLERIKNQFKTDIPIRVDKRNGAKRLRLCSRIVCEDIISYGGTPQKSRTLQPPKINDKFFISFLRGYFDGDGGINKRKRKTEYYYYSSTISCGNKIFLQYIQNKITELNNNVVEKIFTYSNKKGNEYFVLSYPEKETYLLGKLLYPKYIRFYMKRKKQLFDELKEKIKI